MNNEYKGDLDPAAEHALMEEFKTYATAVARCFTNQFHEEMSREIEQFNKEASAVTGRLEKLARGIDYRLNSLRILLAISLVLGLVSAVGVIVLVVVT